MSDRVSVDVWWIPVSYIVADAIARREAGADGQAIGS